MEGVLVFGVGLVDVCHLAAVAVLKGGDDVLVVVEHRLELLVIDQLLLELIVLGPELSQDGQ